MPGEGGPHTHCCCCCHLLLPRQRRWLLRQRVAFSTRIDQSSGTGSSWSSEDVPSLGVTRTATVSSLAARPRNIPCVGGTSA